MNRKLFLGVFFILAIFASATYVNFSAAQATPDASTTLVISQVYGGGGSTAGTPTYNKDYVELKNISSAPQSLNGLSLYYGSATGQFGSSAANTFALPNATVPPGGYYLVELGPVGMVGAALPVPADVSTTNLTVSATSGKIALVNGLAPNSCGATATPCALPNPQIIDVVAYGTANNAEGGAAVAALTNTSGAVRKSNGCQDTDNNAADFDVVTAPVPRNSATAVSPCGGAPTATPDANVDFNGDGRTDYVVTRTDSGGKIWYSTINGTGAFSGFQFGITGDVEVPEDYDGDDKDDIAVWRSGSPAVFYIFQSSNNTVRAQAFGIPGDDPGIVADYDGDNKADVAVYRKSTGQNFFYYLSSVSGNLVSTPWGSGATTRPNVGDYDGDNKADFCVQYDGGSGSGIFALLKSNGGTEFAPFGLTSDKLAPGDYDGDGKDDFTVVRNSSGSLVWYTLSRTNQVTAAQFGLATDVLAPGDYDGDGKQDVSVWRPGAQSIFYSLRSSNGATQAAAFGISTDFAVASWYIH